MDSIPKTFGEFLRHVCSVVVSILSVFLDPFLVAMMFLRRYSSPWTLLLLFIICGRSVMQSLLTNHDQSAIVDYTVLKVDFHYNITDVSGHFLPTTSTYTLKYSQLLRGNWHTSVIQDLSRDVSFEPHESLLGNYLTVYWPPSSSSL